MPLRTVTFVVEESLYKQVRTIGIKTGKPIQEIFTEALSLWIDEWEEENDINSDYLS